jgi:FMN reductase
MALVEFVVKQAATSSTNSIDFVDVADLTTELALIERRIDTTPKLEAVLKKIELADLCVVGTPIANGTYTSVLKRLLDLMSISETEGRVAIIVATDRGDCNSLELERSLRPLLSLLGYYAVPTAVFARDDDFVDLWVAEEAVSVRARRAVKEAFEVLGLKPPLATLIGNRNSLNANDCG